MDGSTSYITTWASQAWAVRWNSEEADWDRIVAINLKGTFLACKHAMPAMLRQGKGAIVNISSLAAIRWTGLSLCGYYAAKAGVNQLTVGIALQYAGQGIRANAIMPGLMNTPLIHQQIAGQYADADGDGAGRDAACPMGRMGTGWDVAHAAVFLASDEAAYITGVCLPVDQGLSCGRHDGGIFRGKAPGAGSGEMSRRTQALRPSIALDERRRRRRASSPRAGPSRPRSPRRWACRSRRSRRRWCRCARRARRRRAGR